jgi:L-Ala-D/L-Glu epimerase
MSVSRRKFLVSAGMAAAGATVIPSLTIGSESKPKVMAKGKMKLSFRPYELKLKHAFTLATTSRTTTPVMLTEIEYDGVTGYGEASMPPYLGESHDTVAKFLAKVDLSKFSNPFCLDDILTYVDGIDTHNCAAKASVDIALHDLLGKLMNQPWYNIWGYQKENTPSTSFTIGIDTDEVVKQKVKEAAPYNILKVKLGRETDKMMIETIRSVSNRPICVDVNQGWKDRQQALDMILWLKEKGVVFVEQPMPKTQLDDLSWLTEKSPLPIIGDEGVQRLDDVIKAKGVYSGINIKLMKCTGMREAHKMIELARALGLKVMIGCMTETSCAVSAAAHLSPKVDWADLDGNLLISNDVYEGMTVINGKVTLTDLPGIGIKKIK